MPRKKVQKRVPDKDWAKIWELKNSKDRDAFWWRDCIIEREQACAKPVTVAKSENLLDTDDWMEAVFAFMKTTDLFEA
jgi:hypothetical protein